MRCDRLHATIRVKQCLRNQGLTAGYNWSAGNVNPFGIPTCRDCPTGRMAREGKLEDEDVEQMIRDEAGKIVANIKGSDQAEKIPKEPEREDETRTCTKCGKTWPITDFYLKNSGGSIRRNQCKHCDKEAVSDWNLRKKERKMLAAKREADAQGGREGILLLQTGGNGSAHEKEEHATQAPSPAKEPEAPTCVLTIDLSGYQELMEEIKLIAEHEERTPEGQVRYWLRRHLGSGKTWNGERHAD